MTNPSFLTFTLHELLLAVDAKAVREIIWLPELSMMEEHPGYIAGVVNLHGKIVPVMDLNLRFGHASQRYRCSDRLIILDISKYEIPKADHSNQEINSECHSSFLELRLLGMIVHEVLDVIELPEEDIEPSPFKGREMKTHPHFIRGEAKTASGIVMILNPLAILGSEFGMDETGPEQTVLNAQPTNNYFCPEADENEKRIFHARAASLCQFFDNGDSFKELSLAVISLNNEYLCVDLNSVVEFSKIHNLAQVPCCPEYIVGNMNLRGNVLTLVDIRGLLNMRLSKFGESAKVIVADTGEFPVGVIVDDILDVISFRERDLVPVPSSLGAVNEKFVKGAAPYGSRMAALLDLREILSWEGLTVNEEV